MSPRARLASGGLVLACAALLAGAGVATAQCTYPALTSGIPTTATSSLQYYYIQPTAPYWGAIGVRPNAAGEDWDISVWRHTAPYPDCVTEYLMGSAEYGPQMDFVVGDFNYTPLDNYEIAVTRWAGSGTGLVEWWGGRDGLIVNAARVERSLGSWEPLHVYDVSLVAGTTYTFHFSPKGGADLHLCVFENAGGGAFFGNRVGAALETDHCATYTPTVTGFHGVAVVCDWGSGTYELGVTNGACSCPSELADGVPVNVPGEYAGVTSLFAMPQTESAWSAIGVVYDGTLPASYLEAYSEPYGGAAPDCLSGLLASDYGVNGGRNWEVLAADFNENSPRTDYALVYAEADVRAEWEQSQDFLFVNDAPYYAGFTAGDVVDVYETYLSAGSTYEGTIEASGVRMRVYAPSAGAPFSPTLVLDTSDWGDFTAAVTGWYGVVVLNVAAVDQAYWVKILGCETVKPLDSKSPRAMFGEAARYSFAQTDQYWSAIGIHNFSSDFDVEVGTGAGEGYPDCILGSLESSMGGEVDYVIGDFNHNPRTTYYARVRGFDGAYSHGETSVEWDAGVDQILANGTHVQGTWTSEDVLDVYDIYLLTGKTYVFNLSGANARLDFFRDKGVPFWAASYDADFSVVSGASHSYTAPAIDWYGVAIVHTDALPGSYATWVYDQSAVDVEDLPQLVTGLTALEPNPARGQVRIQYSLGERGSVGFRVLDIAGREVWRSQPEARDAGRWSAEWGGADAAGRQLAPGIYFLRMTVDDREVALRKVTLLR